MPDSTSRLRGDRTVAIVQARLGSQRLPGKVLADVEGRPLLGMIVDRCRTAASVDLILIATTRRAEDDAIAGCAARLGVGCYRGSEEDCLDRLYRAASEADADVVVRLTGDNPLVDGCFLDWVVAERGAAPPHDLVSSAGSETFPVGLSVEVVTFGALAAAWAEAQDPTEREHVTPFILRRPRRFRVKQLASDVPLGYMRWTVDTVEDLAFVRRVVRHFGGRIDFSWEDAVAAVSAHPDWLRINAHVAQRVVGPLD